MMELVVPSNNFNGIFGTLKGVKLCFQMKADSMKQSVEPESTSALKEMFRMDSEVKGTIDELDKERTEEHNKDALILASLSALAESTRSLESAAIEELWTNFLPGWLMVRWLQRGLSWSPPCDRIGHRGGRDFGPCNIVVPAALVCHHY